MPAEEADMLQGVPLGRQLANHAFFFSLILRKKIECAQYQNNHIHSCRKREQNKQIVAFYFYLNNQYLVFIRLGQV